MNLLILIGIAAVAYAFLDLFISLSGNKIDPNIGATIFNGLGGLLTFIFYIVLRMTRVTKAITTTPGVIYSIIAGVFVAIFGVILVKIFEKGSLSYAMPLVYGLAIALSVIIGWIFLKESISFYHIIGIILIVVGVGFVVAAKV